MTEFNPEIVPHMISIREASDASGMSYDAIRKLCLRNEIVHIRCGAKYLINAQRFADFLNGGGEQQ